MFSYYGTKKKLAKYYPKPLHDIIIEPFAGAAAYSMMYHDHNVILCEKDEKIYKLWKYLQSATEDDIMKLPILEKGVSLNLPEYKDNYRIEEIYLMGFYLNPGSSQPKKSPGTFCSWNENTKKKIVEDLPKIKHWTILHGDYQQLDNMEATWYVDSPYQSSGGQYYHHGNKGFDYQTLAKWTLGRKGQVIVCENLGSDWLDFQPLINLKGQKHNRMEAIYYIENNIPQIEIPMITKQIQVEERKLNIDPNLQITKKDLTVLTSVKEEDWFDILTKEL